MQGMNQSRTNTIDVPVRYVQKLKFQVKFIILFCGFLIGF